MKSGDTGMRTIQPALQGTVQDTWMWCLAVVSHADSHKHTWVKCGKTVTLDRWGSKPVGKNKTIPGDRKVQQKS